MSKKNAKARAQAQRKGTAPIPKNHGAAPQKGAAAKPAQKASGPKKGKKDPAKAKAQTPPQASPYQVGGTKVPAIAYKFRDPATGLWTGPVMDLFAAKQAGGGVRSGYDPVWVWYDPDRRVILGYLTAEEILRLDL